MDDESELFYDASVARSNQELLESPGWALGKEFLQEHVSQRDGEISSTAGFQDLVKQPTALSALCCHWSYQKYMEWSDLPQSVPIN